MILSFLLLFTHKFISSEDNYIFVIALSKIYPKKEIAHINKKLAK